jgi:short-subunit dehydrogenase
MMATLKGQTAIITGASAGIGEAIARRLAQEGATVVITARRQDRLESIRQEVAAAGGRAIAIAGDINSVALRERLVNETMKATGRIDALINNAGYGQRGPIEIVPLDAIRQNFETNLFSVIGVTQLVIPIMRRQNSGRIINISSVAGKVARPLSSVYDATKHALEAISDGLRGELAPFGIKVVVIEPGFITTEFLGVANHISKSVIEKESPYKPFFEGSSEGFKRLRKMAGTPDDIARLVRIALTSNSPRARYAAPRHARLAIALKRILPEKIYDSILNKSSGMRIDKAKSS